MNPIQGNILFRLCQQANIRVWYYDTVSDLICYVTADGNTEEAVPFNEHMAMKHPDDCAQVYESMEYMIANREPVPDPLMIRYRDVNQPDGYRYTLNVITPIFNGSVISVVGTEQDITPMVRKQQLAEKQTALIEELLRHRNGTTWTIDRNTKTIKMKRKDGSKETATLQELVDKMDFEDGKDGQDTIEVLHRGEPKILEFYAKEKEAREDGMHHCFKCTSMPSKYDYRGNVTEYVGVATDITLEIAEKRKLMHTAAEARNEQA